MADELKARAMDGYRRLAHAEAVAKGEQIPSGPSRCEQILESPDSSPEAIFDACRGTCDWLVRGDGDRWLVGKGELPYLDTFRIPIDLWRHCLSLQLGRETREFAERRLSGLERSHEYFQNQRGEQAGDGDA